MIARAVFLSMLILLLRPPVIGWCEDGDIAKLFSDRKVQGTIVVKSLDGSDSWIHNDQRANTGLIPASTFKIPNTLIALDANVIDEKEVLTWDGKDSGIEGCNRDQTLETAFKSSCVWFFQDLARRIGQAHYLKILKEIGYGNASPAPNVETFWLAGDLRIGAIAQVDFLKRIYLRELPFRPSSYDTLQKIMVIEQKPTYTLRGKTGWGRRVSPQIGWFVGYIESRGKTWFFATNIVITKPEDMRYRQEITLEALRLKGIL